MDPKLLSNPPIQALGVPQEGRAEHDRHVELDASVGLPNMLFAEITKAFSDSPAHSSRYGLPCS